MSLQLVAKIGAAGTAVAGIPATYFVWDNYFSLNEIENTILGNSSTNWEVSVEDSESKVVAKATANITPTEGGSSPTSYKWECEITSVMPQGKTKENLKTYLESKLKQPPNKESHRWHLVKACSKNRKQKEDTAPTTQKATLELKVVVSGTKISTYLLGEEETTTSS